MDTTSQLKTGLDTFFDERMSFLLANLMSANPQYRALCNNIKEQKDNMRNMLDERTLVSFDSFLTLMIQQADVEKQYLFGQGISDCGTALAYMQGEMLTRNYIDTQDEN